MATAVEPIGLSTKRAQCIADAEERLTTLTSIQKAMARVFWFTIGFGLVRGPDGGLKAHGSGLLSSTGEPALIEADLERVLEHAAA
jgi:phenylalanine-4-hydroxylase